MKSLLSTTLFSLLFTVGCGKDAEDAATTVFTAEFPQVHAIPISAMLATSTQLTQEEDECANASFDHLFSLTYAGACTTAPMVSSLLIGDTPPDFDCANYDTNSGTNYGVLTHLICSPALQEKTTSYAIQEDDGSRLFYGVSFAQFGSDDVVGHWNPGGKDSYPADIRIWKGESMDALEGFIAIHLESANEGTVHLNSFGDDKDWKAKFDFKNQADTANCAAAVSKENCHWQQVQIYAGEGVITDGPPNGFNLTMYADSKTAPTLLALEGKFRYTAEYIAQAISDTWATNLGLNTGARNFYFATAQKGNNIYGAMDIRDANDTRLSYQFPGRNDDYYEVMAGGGCITLGETISSPFFGTCDSVNGDDYTNLWSGYDATTNITAAPSTINFDGPPTELGFFTAE